MIVFAYYVRPGDTCDRPSRVAGGTAGTDRYFAAVRFAANLSNNAAKACLAFPT